MLFVSGTELDHNTLRRCIYHTTQMADTHALAKEVAAVSGWLATVDAICTNLKLPGALQLARASTSILTVNRLDYFLWTAPGCSFDPQGLPQTREGVHRPS